MADFMQVDNARLRAPAGGQDNRTSASADNRDVENFDRALRREENDQQGKQDGGDQGGPDSQKGGQHSPFSMTSPLDSLFSNRLSAPASAAGAQADTALMDKLVERILVATPPEGGAEVRISLSDGLLRGTEIQLLRGNDGLLTVNVQTNDAASFQTLVAARDSLQGRLELLGEQVRVTVSEQAEQQDNNSERRSQGYMDYTDDKDRV